MAYTGIKSSRPRPEDPIIHLCVPAAPVPVGGKMVHRKIVNRFKLRWTTRSALSTDLRGVILDYKGSLFDGHCFRRLRDTVGAWIETSDPDIIRAALRVPGDELGIVPPSGFTDIHESPL